MVVLAARPPARFMAHILYHAVESTVSLRLFDEEARQAQPPVADEVLVWFTSTDLKIVGLGRDQGVAVFAVEAIAVVVKEIICSLGWDGVFDVRQALEIHFTNVVDLEERVRVVWIFDGAVDEVEATVLVPVRNKVLVRKWCVG